ncbi:hypothetical protein [Streptomyces sp. NPDC097619]|uniref:hypothetical protein n=1 Tax=Streptomyces sp. NPDC097619 TaxID=3157228 RepID=UPI00331E63CA
MRSGSGGEGRLLPWASAEGKPCFLFGDASGYFARVADDVERMQLEMADELLAHADDILADCRATSAQLHYLAARLAEVLRDVHRVARSRGARLPVPVHEGG